MIYIRIEELVGNAFVGYLKRTEKRELSLQKIENFGNNVIRELNRKGIKSALLLSRDKTYNFFKEYSDMFLFREEDGMIILNENISVKDLIENFSGYLSLEVLYAFRNEENIKTLEK
mgnify:FL=1